MAHALHKKDNFEWTAGEFLLAFLAGIVAVGGLWLFSGLLIGLFFL